MNSYDLTEKKEKKAKTTYDKSNKKVEWNWDESSDDHWKDWDWSDVGWVSSASSSSSSSPASSSIPLSTPIEPCGFDYNKNPLSHPNTLQILKSNLLAFLHNDLIGMVLAYASEIHLFFQRDIKLTPNTAPKSIAVSGNEIFVATRIQEIKVFEQTSGKFLRSSGTRLEQSGNIFPNDMDIFQDEIYITDTTGQIAVLSTTDFKLRTNWSFQWPKKLCVSNNQVYCTNGKNYSIDIFSTCGKRQPCSFDDSVIFKEEYPTFFMKLGGMFVQDEELFFVDRIYGIVVVINLTKKRLAETVSFHHDLDSIVVHGSQIILTNPFIHCLVSYDRESQKRQKFGGYSYTTNQGHEFDLQNDLAIGLNNELFVCDEGKSRIRIFK